MNTAFVKIWDEVVGAVLWQPERGYASFEYDPKFKTKKWDLAPIKMPVDLNTNIYSFPELKSLGNSEYDTFKGLPGLLADVLPDRYGNRLINTWLAQNGRPPDSMNPIEQLCFIGTRGIGALEFEPSTGFGKNNQVFNVEVDSLITTARKMLDYRERFQADLRGNEEKAMMEILKIGTSAGGARPKAIITYNETTGQVRSGQATTQDGFEHWLLKLDGVSDAQFGESSGYGRVEMAYYLMAKDCGIHMMESRLLEENGRAHFMTKRFDREKDKKHHIQTFCAMNHFDFNEVTSFSYEQLFQTMRILRLPYPQAEQMYRRMVFNVLSKNCDDHTKNFAFRLRKEGEWELAPAYDICYAYRPDSIWVSQHALSINGKRKDLYKKDLMTFAKEMNIKKASEIIEQISNVVYSWENYAKETGVRKDLTKIILKNIQYLS